LDTYKNVQSTKKTILFSASQGSKEDPGVSKRRFQEEDIVELITCIIFII
jgi:hypothetical protein